MPATFHVYRARIHKLYVRKVTKNADTEQEYKQTNTHKKYQLDNDKTMRKTCMLRKKSKFSLFYFFCIWYHEMG